MRAITIVFIAALLIGLSVGGPTVSAQDEVRTDQSCPPSTCPSCPGSGPTKGCPSTIGHRGFGLSVGFPFAMLPPDSGTAMLFLNLFAQGDLGENVFHRTEVRFFFGTSGFQPSLTSVRESLLVAFTPPPAVLYVGGGAGTFPIESFANNGGQGFLLSLFARMGIEVQVAPLGLFLDLSYETMPQPFVDIENGLPPISNLELGFGAVFHF